MNEAISNLKNDILAILNNAKDVNTAIDTVLEKVGKYFNVDRAYIFENSEDDLCCDNTFEWCNVGITPEKDNLQHLRYLEDLGGEWIDNYDENGMFFCPTVSELPEKQREILDPQGIFSMLQCAIMEQGVFKGYIGFDNCQDHLGGWEYDKEAVDALVFISRLLSLYLLEARNKNRLLERNKELEQALNTKSNFLSRMSHELRTPLNAVIGYSSLLEADLEADTMSNEEKKNVISSIHRASDYLLELIGDALDIQAMEHGKLKLESADVDAINYMGDIVKVIRQEAEEKQLNFVFEKQSQFSESYHLDGIRMQQVLLNLLHNAIKFTPEGGSVHFLASEEKLDDRYVMLHFVVSDTGIGMSDKFIKNHLYTPFSQENQDISSPYTGCGMGLFICKEIVERMHGKIECQSELGKGTTFTVSLRARPVCKRTEKEHVNASKPEYDLSGIRVLLCEDNPMNQDMEKRILNRMNCVVDIAEDGETGYQKFASSENGYYSVILMDIRMPKMNGLEAAKAIRALNRKDATQTPIFAVSANAFEEDVQKSLAAGMNEHLAKPVDAKILHDKIKVYCG